MTLQSFEQLLSDGQVAKGFDYFESGSITELEEWESGKWNAIVTGTEDYQVKIKLKKEVIETCSCNCPHDTDYCKHIIAVLYAIKEEKNNHPDKMIESNKKSTNGASGKPKDTIRDMVNKIPEKDLRLYIIEHAGTDREFRNLLVAHFSGILNEGGTHLYAKIIKNAARAAAGRHGFIDYNNAARAIKPVHLLLQKAETAFGNGHYSIVADIAFAVIANVHDMVTEMDDSSGSGGDCINEGFELLTRLCNAGIPNDLKERIFKDAEKEAKNKKYDFAGFDEHWLDILVYAAYDRKKEQQLLQLIDSLLSGLTRKTDEWINEYSTSRLLRHKMDLLRRMGQSADADSLRLRHLNIADFRMELIKETLAKKEYAAARKLIAEGITIAKKKGRPGTVESYKVILLRIASELNDIPDVRAIAKELYAGRNMEYYRIIKRTFNKQEWPAIAEDFINDLQKVKPIPGFHGTLNGTVLADIFIEEGYWGRLLELLQKNPRLDFIEHYTKLLVDEFPLELLAIYKVALINYAAHNTGRNYYVIIRQTLKKMQGWKGGGEVVKQLTDQFILQYKARKAMIEELNKIGK